MQTIDRRQFLISTLGAAIAAALLDGCGGGGGGGGGVNLQRAAGSVALPAGASINLTDLTVMNAYNNSSVAAGGVFNLQASAVAPSLVAITHSNGRLVMYGFVDPSSTSNVLDANAQAVALLYMMLGGYTLPTAHKREILALFKNDPSVPPLAAAISARMAANPFAIDDADSQITDALTAAMGALGGSSRHASPSAGSAASAPSRLRRGTAQSQAGTRVFTVPVQETISPPGPQTQSGIEIDDSGTGGIVAVNHYRRRGEMYVYATGDDSSGTFTTYTPKLVAGPVEIEPTEELNASTTISGLFGGTAPFIPTTSAAVPLTIAAGVNKKTFDVIVAGSNLNLLGFPPPFYKDYPTTETDTWEEAVKEKNLWSLWADILLSIFLEVLSEPLTSQQVSAIVNSVVGLKAITDPGVISILQDIKAGKLVPTLPALLQLFINNDNLSLQLRYQLSLIVGDPATRVAIQNATNHGVSMLQYVLGNFVKFFKIAGFLAKGGDLLAIYHDLGLSNHADQFKVTLERPKISIAPASANLQGGGRQLFTVTVPPAVVASIQGAGGSLIYDWDTTVQFGQMDDGAGKTGKHIETVSTTAYLTTTPLDMGKVTVTVTALAKGPAGGTTPIGVASADVSIGGPLTLQESGRFDVDSHSNTGGTGCLATAIVAWPKVNKAINYQVHIHGYNDPAYWGTDRVFDFDPTNLAAQGVADHGSELWFGLAGSGSASGDCSDAVSYYRGRFAGMIVDVTVTYLP